MNTHWKKHIKFKFQRKRKMKLVVFSFAMILLCGSSMQQSGKSVLEMFPEFNDLKTKMQAQIAEVESIGNNVDDLMSNCILFIIRFKIPEECQKQKTFKLPLCLRIRQNVYNMWHMKN